MKPAVLLAISAAAVLNCSCLALAQETRICIDASDHNQYDARPLSLHGVLARNAVSRDRRIAKISTTCIHIDRSASVALHSMTRCIGLGDEVFVSNLGGPGERCRVTGVTPAAESYADAPYKTE